MKMKKRLLSILLSLALMLGLMPEMSMTVYASTLNSESTTWSENSDIAGDVTINNNVTVDADITLTIPAGKILTINGQFDYGSTSVIDAYSHTLTVSGGGTLIVNAPAEDGDHSPIEGICGELIVDGATVQVTGGGDGVFGNVTVKSGLVCVNGGNGNGGDGISGDVIVNGGSITVVGGNGGNGGYGGDGISRDVIVSGGSITVVGGNGGNGDNGDGGSGGDGVSGNVIVNGGSATITGGNGGTKGSDIHAIDGYVGQAVYGSITGNAEESEDNTNWTSVTDNTSSKQYIKFEPILVTGVSLNETTTQTIDIDEKVSFTATVSPNNAPDKTVKWSVGGTNATAVKLYSDENCTTEVGTDATSTLTVYAKGISAGNATVTCTSNADSEKSASCNVTVNAYAGNPYASLVNTTTSVKFNDMDWYIIVDDSTAVDAGTVTLLSKDPIGASKFHESENSVYVYSTSLVKDYLDSLTGTGGTFKAVADAIVTVKVKGSDRDSEVDAKLWLLSTSEAEGLSEDVRKCSTAMGYFWWLRSRGLDSSKAALVYCVDGEVSGSGDNPWYEYGVRPALKLDLSKVTFDSSTKKFELTPVVEYPLWVGGEQVTSENASNIDGDNKASFDPETNTLTLNNYSYSGEGNKSDISATAGIYSNGIDLSIELIGTNTITTNGSAQSQSGIDIVNGNLTITARDNGSLTVTGGNSNDMGSISNGICVRRTLDDSARDSKLTIADGATVNAAVNTTNEFASGTGVYANDGLDVSGTLIADGGNGGRSFGVQTNGDVDVSGTLIATAGSSVAESYGIYTYKNVTVREGGVVKASAIGNTSAEMCKGVGIYTWTAWDESTQSEVDGKVIIEGGEVTASGYDCGIQSRDSVIIKGGKVTATAEEGNGIRCGARNWETGIYENGTISFEGGSVTASGSDKGVYAQNVSISDGLTAMAGDEAPGADVTNTFATNHDQKWVKVEPPKIPQDITAPDVTVTYGDIDKSVSASVTYPTEGGGAISYAVKDGSKDYIDVDATTGALTIKKVGTATVIVTAAETSTYAQATKEVTVTISKSNAVAVKVTANNRTYDGTDKPLVNVDDSTLVGGEMYYAVTTENKAPTDEKLYTTDIPTATNAGTYYVWYKVIGDENHSDFTADKAVLVEIKADTTAPTGEISIDTNKWTSFLSTITFGLFFKETKEVTITAEDDLTGVEKIEYYVSDQALSLEQVKTVTEWKTYESTFKLNPEKKYVVYARLTDKAGNITYISSNGLVFVNLPVGYVTDITENSATLNMQLSAAVQSEVRTAGFEYKKKADADMAWTKVEGDFASGTVTKKLTSLTTGTDYVFRPYVTYTNDSTDTGADQNFTTDTKPAVTGSIDVKVKNDTEEKKDVVVTIEEGNYALASQEKDGIAAGGEVTTGKFKELPDGTYNIVIKSKDGEFVETKMITIANGAAETISFTISKGEMKTDVEVEADTPKVAVDGLSKEELVQSGTITSEEKTKVESGEISLEVTLKAEKKETSKVETKTVSAIQQVMAESSTKLVVDMFLDLSLFKTVTQLTGDQAGKTDETNIGSTNTKVLEIAVPYDTTIKGLVVYRYHGSAASALKKLSSAPAKGAAHEDGTFYLSDKYIHIFASGFSTYAIAKEEENSSGGSGGGGGTTPVTPGKITPSKPAAPTLDSKTDTSITVKTVAGQEYSRDGGKTWQTSGTFTGLTPETEYSIVTKIAATSTANESPVSDALKVTTDKKADSSTPTPGSTTTPTDKPTETPGSTTAPTDKPTETPGATDTPSTTTTPGATSAPADKVTKTEKAKAKLSLNAGLKVSCVGKKVTVKWGKVSKADRYVVYAAYCGPDKCTKIKALSGSKTSMTFTKLNGSKLNLKKNVKVYVIAYRKVNGKETKLAKSITAHVVGTKNEKYTNVKKIKLSKSSYTLKVNKTATVKAEIVLEDKKKKQLSDGHAPEFRYASSNTKVATVDKNGKIKAVGKGTCYIYVYAKNGYAKKIKVVVK